MVIVGVRNRNWPASHAINCLLFVHSEGWITLSTLVHIISSSTTLTHGLVIGVVMKINEIGQCIMVRSSGQIQQKSTKEWEKIYAFQWLWMKWRVVSTDCQLEVELVPTEQDLDYQCVYVFLLLYLLEQLDFNCCCNILICLILF
jgi:hypothetical protein